MKKKKVISNALKHGHKKLWFCFFVCLQWCNSLSFYYFSRVKTPLIPPDSTQTQHYVPDRIADNLFDLCATVCRLLFRSHVSIRAAELNYGKIYAFFSFSFIVCLLINSVHSPKLQFETDTHTKRRIRARILFICSFDKVHMCCWTEENNLAMTWTRSTIVINMRIERDKRTHSRSVRWFRVTTEKSVFFWNFQLTGDFNETFFLLFFRPRFDQ